MDKSREETIQLKRLLKARTVSQQLIDKYLPNKGWKIIWDDSRRRLGQTNFSNKTISLSIPYIKENEFKITVDTILHEIAHAIVGAGHGHDETWRRAASIIGADPKATCSCAKVETKYVGKCLSCGQKVHANKISNSLRHTRCRLLGKSGKIVWRKIS